jgi:cytochrome c-type biogenesis protein CcmE
MNPERQRRLVLVVFIVVVTTVGVGLVVYALRENINLFYTPSQINAGAAPLDSRIRIGGMVVSGSFSRNPDSLMVSFDITDGIAQVGVLYTGILPDLFAENEAAVATGTLNSEGVFLADEVMAKHDEEYIPPEVSDAMEEAYKMKSAPENSTLQ